ncbi:hypothetical protein GQF01_24775 [Paenibacillus sp. 5J-6]|uniref:Uncharacterized protein n=1 Tax=Paenibacillus silvestris TaxID=2606219 RepID=A0A6L8V6V6_9BACL|nr:hypothetical protein [Paenibacillus silvestris]
MVNWFLLEIIAAVGNREEGESDIQTVIREMLEDPIPKQFEFMNNQTFSPLLKDNVYLIVSEWIKDHRFTDC